MSDPRPDFALDVCKDGYAWWYIDGVSHDGEHAITIIAFVGSVFSPYYKSARRKGPTDPEEHCAINVAIYSRGSARWAMTERGKGQLTRSADHFRVGSSSLSFDGEALTIEIDETAFPFLAPVRGTVRLIPEMRSNFTARLDKQGRHIWQPFAPVARISVDMREPALSWNGHGYFDHNHGREPIENGFRAWNWSRSDAGRSALILYETDPRQGEGCNLALKFQPDGTIEPFEPPPRVALARSFWRVARETRSEDNTAHVLRTLEDAPFYSRSMIRSRLDGRMVTGVHESLSLDRFAHPLVQKMLPFRMPRAGNSRRFF